MVAYAVCGLHRIGLRRGVCDATRIAGVWLPLGDILFAGLRAVC
ncbi:hypothetical protein FACS1894133_6950 [Clostridia bacterium]|nr:hypothetical protein FACS1894133_6950 [Clostridia bacterium]